MRHYRTFASLTLSLMLCTCASRPPETLPVSTKKIFVTNLSEPRIELVGGGFTPEDMGELGVNLVLGGIGSLRDRRAQADEAASNIVNRELAARSLRVGALTQEVIVAALRARGYEVAPLPPELTGPPDDPLDLPMDKLQGRADAVVVLRFQDSQIFMRRFSGDIEPQLNLGIELHIPSVKRSLLDRVYYYGNDAARGKRGHFPTPPACLFPAGGRLPLGEAMDRLTACLHDGAQQMSVTASEDLLIALPAPAP